MRFGLQRLYRRCGRQRVRRRDGRDLLGHEVLSIIEDLLARFTDLPHDVDKRPRRTPRPLQPGRVDDPQIGPPPVCLVEGEAKGGRFRRRPDTYDDGIPADLHPFLLDWICPPSIGLNSLPAGHGRPSLGSRT